MGSEREEVDLNARSTRSHNQATDWRLVRKYGGGKHLDADLLSPQPDISRRLLCSLMSQLTVFIACFSNNSVVIGEQRRGRDRDRGSRAPPSLAETASADYSRAQHSAALGLSFAEALNCIVEPSVSSNQLVGQRFDT